MGSIDHIALPVANYKRSRDWYVNTLGLEIEFDAGDRRTVAVRDDRDLSIFLCESTVPPEPSLFAFWFQVGDVEATYRTLSDRGVVFKHGPQTVEWGYGAELRDPDGYRICLWDQKTMPKTRS